MDEWVSGRLVDSLSVGCRQIRSGARERVSFLRSYGDRTELRPGMASGSHFELTAHAGLLHAPTRPPTDFRLGARRCLQLHPPAYVARRCLQLHPPTDAAGRLQV